MCVISYSLSNPRNPNLQSLLKRFFLPLPYMEDKLGNERQRRAAVFHTPIRRPLHISNLREKPIKAPDS